VTSSTYVSGVMTILIVFKEVSLIYFTIELPPSENRGLLGLLGIYKGCKAGDDEIMTSIYPNYMRTFIRLGRAEALLPLELGLWDFFCGAGG